MRAVLLMVTAVAVTSSVTGDFLWTPDNCPETVGNVTDTLCCGPSTFCRKLVSETACTSEVDGAALYCEWSEGQCQPIVDRRSNVCCRDQEVNSCAKMFSGECPEQFEVARECCQGDAYTKFAFLKTSEPAKICCNAPCAAMEAANCTLPAQCGPTQRSFGLHNPYLSLGFYGHGNHAFDHRFGTIYYGTGFGHDYPPYGRRHKKHRKHKKSKQHHKKDHYDDHKDDYDDHKDDYDDHYDDHKDHDHDDYYKDYDYSKEDHVDEITVDDIFALMIDAMEKESDVKVYDADITSDPYLGKNWSGGLFVDHHFPDLEPIFDELYRYPNYYGHYGLGPYGAGSHLHGLNYGGLHSAGHLGSHYPLQGSHFLQSGGQYSPHNGQHTQQNGHYPEQSDHYSEQSSHYPEQSGHYQQQSGHYPELSSYYPEPNSHYPEQSGHYQQQSGHYPESSSHYPGQSGHHQHQSGHYPEQSSHYQGGQYPAQGDLYQGAQYAPTGDFHQGGHIPLPQGDPYAQQSGAAYHH